MLQFCFFPVHLYYILLQLYNLLLFLKNSFIYLFWAVLGLHGRVDFRLAVVSRGSSLVVVRGATP